ncbi:zinc-binding dehydrogenase [Streptomyces sp. NPDC060366]|uniref:zinc-binding dehydrogenase n=1 Tax=Streptomyces sp. NPDC060366 TaxID=3347105 RepID=UPI0036464170
MVGSRRTRCRGSRKTGPRRLSRTSWGGLGPQTGKGCIRPDGRTRRRGCRSRSPDSQPPPARRRPRHRATDQIAQRRSTLPRATESHQREPARNLGRHTRITQIEMRYDRMSEFARLADEGVLAVSVARTYTLDEIQEAAKLSQSRRPGGKLMLVL